ncbi:GlxA family transcriptional regulator [Bordetella genomosp. 1]|uniref:AraC family transcriptional regulator n=1 Tax=Bordetella genomosp. 1 TaxID=1395607 RepID=A0ABX4EZ61_9BORD|nr:helix-turn-helix domain-containing protein [Bordetella genomosp. 1]OZI65041.1 AraC family transcriptional regulator [Bordetella genomosp. 1]
MPSDPTAPVLRLLLLPLPDFALLPFGAFIDKLRFSADDDDRSRQRHCRWSLLGLDDGPIASSSGVSVNLDLRADAVDFGAYDYLVIFGSRSAEAARALAPRYAPLLRAARRHGLPLVSIDNGSFLLAQARLLDGYRVALHWRHVDEFRQAFPRIAVAPDALYCFDRDRISCAGGTAAIDMAVALLARHCGAARASKGLADMLVDGVRPLSHRLRSHGGAPQTNRYLARALTLMRETLRDAPTVDALARQCGVGRRHLDRLFQAEFGMSAHAFLQGMRMEIAHWRLLNSSHSVAAIADEIGLGNAGSLRRLYAQHYGCTPGEARRRG